MSSFACYPSIFTSSCAQSRSHSRRTHSKTNWFLSKKTSFWWSLMVSLRSFTMCLAGEQSAHLITWVNILSSMRNSSQFTTKLKIKTWKVKINYLTSNPSSTEHRLGYHPNNMLKSSLSRCKLNKNSSTQLKPGKKTNKNITSTSLSNLNSLCSKTSSTWTWSDKGTFTSWKCSLRVQLFETKKVPTAQAQKSKWS